MLIVNSLYAPYVVGGAEVVAEMLAATLAAQGHLASVVTSCSRDQDFGIERMDGVEVYRFFPKNRWWLYERFAPNDRRSTIETICWRIRDAWNLDAGHRFEKILDQVQPDVLHTHNIKGFSPIIWQIAKRKGIPIIHTAHSYELICARGSLLASSGETCVPTSRCTICKVHGAWYRAQAAAIDVFCSPSRFLLETHAEAGVVPKRCEHVRNGIARVPIAISDQPRSGRPLRYLFMGQLTEHKGIGILIRAICLSRGSEYTIDIAGRGDWESELRALAAADDRVSFHGFVEGERKYRLLSDADVLIFPSVWVENSPMSIAEALCYGVPVIGSRLGAIPELIEHGTNGLLFEAGSPASLSACMTDLLERQDELRRLKVGAIRSGNSWPTPEAMTSNYLSIYRSLLQDKGGNDPSDAQGNSE